MPLATDTATVHGMTIFWLMVAMFWVTAIFAANGLGEQRGRDGAPYGLFLGWLGVLLLACLPPKTR